MGSFLRSSSAAAGRARGHKVRKSCAPVRIPMLPNSAEADGRGGGRCPARRGVRRRTGGGGRDGRCVCSSGSNVDGQHKERCAQRESRRRQRGRPPVGPSAAGPLLSGRLGKMGERRGSGGRSIVDRTRTGFFLGLRPSGHCTLPPPPSSPQQHQQLALSRNRQGTPQLCYDTESPPTDRPRSADRPPLHSLTHSLAGWLAAKCQVPTSMTRIPIWLRCRTRARREAPTPRSNAPG